MSLLTSITPDILTALKLEAKAMVDGDTGLFAGDFVMATDFKGTGEVTYSFPLVMMYLSNAHDSEPLCGGSMKVNWNFSFACYWYDPNMYVDDETGFSEQLSQPVDIVRRHFGGTNRRWLTQGMKDIEQKYNFRMTCAGITPAPKLAYSDGLALGFAVLMDTVSLDSITDSIQICEDPLETVKQVDYPPAT